MSKPHPNFNPGPAQLGLSNSGAGKGDKDRSPGWRDHYDEIDWGVIDPFIADGTYKIIRKGGKVIKKYGKKSS